MLHFHPDVLPNQLPIGQEISTIKVQSQVKKAQKEAKQ